MVVQDIPFMLHQRRAANRTCARPLLNMTTYIKIIDPDQGTKVSDR